MKMADIPSAPSPCPLCGESNCPTQQSLVTMESSSYAFNHVQKSEFTEVISSVEELMAVNSKLHESISKNKNVVRLYYRGERHHYKNLLPSLTVQLMKGKVDLYGIHKVNSPLHLQLRLLQRLQRYTAQYHFDSSIQRPLNFFEWVCLGQHHGLPTLLLDWSLNPLVGLFFSLDDPCGEHEKSNGQIWIMELKSKVHRKGLAKYLGNEQIEAGFEHLTNLPDDTPDVTTAQSAPKFTLDPLIIVPRILTRRIDSQAGRFIFSAEEKGLNELTEAEGYRLAWETPIQRYLVPCCRKQQIRKELRNLRIHEGTMYADLDAYARFLKDGGL